MSFHLFPFDIYFWHRQMFICIVKLSSSNPRSIPCWYIPNHSYSNKANLDGKLKYIFGQSPRPRKKEMTVSISDDWRMGI